MASLDKLLPLIDEIRNDGAFVLLKWDGERSSRVCSVVITRQDTDFVWRKDSDQISVALEEAIADYWVHHEKPAA